MEDDHRIFLYPAISPFFLLPMGTVFTSSSQSPTRSASIACTFFLPNRQQNCLRNRRNQSVEAGSWFRRENTNRRAFGTTDDEAWRTLRLEKQPSDRKVRVALAR